MNDTRKEGDRGPAEEAALSARLRSLGDRLDRLTADRNVGNNSRDRSTADPSALARALRLSAELVGGVAIGGVLGWVIDHWLGTSPWAFIVLLLLGFTAGVLNVMRAAGVVKPPGGGNETTD